MLRSFSLLKNIARSCARAGRILPFIAVFAFAACDDEHNLSAAKGSERFFFEDSVAWIDSTNAMTVVFVQKRLPDDVREEVYSRRTSNPLIGEGAPFLEMHLEFKPKEPTEGKDGKPEGFQRHIGAGDVSAVQWTFWNYDDPPPVVRFDNLKSIKTGDLELKSIEGEFKPGGYLVGTMRAQSIVKDSRGHDDAYLVNLSALAISIN